MASPLKFNTRTLKAFHNRQCFALSSAEGRIAIRYVDEAMDNACVWAGRGGCRLAADGSAARRDAAQIIAAPIHTRLRAAPTVAVRALVAALRPPSPPQR